MSWKPIKTAPGDGTHVLIWAEGYPVTEAFFVDDRSERYDGSYWERFNDEKWFIPTHWKPLPDPPA